MNNTIHDRVYKQELVSLREKAVYFFKLKRPGHREWAEDFGQFCVEKWLSGRCPYTSFEFLIIDYLRQYFIRDPKRRKKAKAEEELLSKIPLEKHKVFAPESIPTLFEEAFFKRYRMKERERSFVILFYEYGLTLKECGRVFGITESGMCVVKQKLFKRIENIRRKAHEKREKRVYLQSSIGV